MNLESLISSLLITAGIGILAGSIAGYIYRIPIRISANGTNRNDTIKGNASIGWGAVTFCLIPDASGWEGRVRLRKKTLIHQHLFPSPKESPPPAEIPEPEPEKDGGKFGLTELIRYLPLIPRILHELVDHLEIESIFLDLRFGAGDPVTTGTWYGYYHAIRPLITGRICSLTVVPDFDTLTLEGDASGVLLITRPFGFVLRVTSRILAAILPDILSGIRKKRRESLG